MNPEISARPLPIRKTWSPSASLDAFCRTALLDKCANLKKGYLEIAEQNGNLWRFGDPACESGIRARLTVRNPRGYARIALGGSIGAGESYVSGDWDCDDLTALVRIFVANRGVLQNLDGGLGKVLRPLDPLFHRMRENSVRGSRENIRAHYDLGNDFFALFLDETMMYSCGIFPSAASSLREASVEKNDRICRKLDLRPGDHLVEIGTGWGGFALHAAKNFGCRVTTTTISQSQYDLARERIKAAGLENRITILFEDYRNLRGSFDKLVSIEMVEAVGLNNLRTYFKKCGDLLKPDGAMLLQAITIQDQYYEEARRSVDFIQKYIFPGSGIPSVSSLVEAAAKSTDMRLFHQEDITAHYPRTLRRWSERLQANQSRITALGYPEHLHRLWQFYFSYCEGGFLERSIGAAQMLFAKPENRKEPLLGVL